MYLLRSAITVALLALFGGSASSAPDSTDLSVMPEFHCPPAPLEILSGDQSVEGEDLLPSCYIGPCDNPAVRDASIPDSETPIKYIRLHFHILRDDDANYPTSNEAQIAEMVATLNAAYLPWRFQFTYDWRYANSSEQRQIVGWTEFAQFKELLAIDYTTHCNIYFAYFFHDGGSSSWSIYAQDSRSTTAQGGIVFDPSQLTTQLKHFLAPHEMGHVLGLYHTHCGVSEVPSCSSCSELVGASNRDHVFDFCSDTEAAPLSGTCTYPPGVDLCSGNPWVAELPENYMGFAYTCNLQFTPQQAGRMHCWTEDRHSDWIAWATFDGTGTFGAAPLTAQFTGLSGYDVSSWDWNFGDGSTAQAENPAHTYTSPGVYAVSVDAATASETFSDAKEDYVWVHADTISLSEVAAQTGNQVRVELVTHNYVPIQILEIPISWEGPLEMTLDSISVVGLRTALLPQAELAIVDNSAKRAIIVLNGLTQMEILPGSGSIASLFFSLPAGVGAGENIVAIQSYYGNDLRSITRRGTYRPTSTDGLVAFEPIICCRDRVGDVNQSGDPEPTIGDITTLIDVLFINEDWTSVPCLTAADINQSGGADPGREDITIGDISYLIDYMFITGHSKGLPDCL